MSSSEKDMFLFAPEDLLDCLGRITETKIIYKWHGDKKISFEIFSAEKKIEYFVKVANVIRNYISDQRGIECQFSFSQLKDLQDSSEEDAPPLNNNPNFMPNKSINRLILIFQSPEDDFRLLRFAAGEGILKGHRYFDPDPNIVEIECNSLQKSFQICSKTKNAEQISNIFEINANCIGIPQYYSKYQTIFDRLPNIIKQNAIISLVRLNPKQKKEDLCVLIQSIKNMIGRVYLSLSVDSFVEKKSHFLSLNCDGFILTVGAKEMNKKDKAHKIQQIKEDSEITSEVLFLFYGSYQKTPSLVGGAKELLYLRKFET